MSQLPKICLIGDIVVDVFWTANGLETKVRLGGIVHAARALWALDVPYDVYYFAPEYLDQEISAFLTHHGCITVRKIGNIIGAPYVFLVGEPKEIGAQGYEFLLRDQIVAQYNETAICQMILTRYEDHFLISGNYDLAQIANRLPNRVHIDLANNIHEIQILLALVRKIDVLFISTSSAIFHKEYQNDFADFVKKFAPFSDEMILKENRGGSRCFNFINQVEFHAAAQPRLVQHSVGVGDSFDVAYIVSKYHLLLAPSHALAFSSWVASEYATTSYPDDFKTAITRLLSSNLTETLGLIGTFLPWETRKGINIYIAAPDFDHVDRTFIDALCNALSYHNFTPRRPIKEHGQMEINASKIRRQELVNCDLQLLSECSILIGVVIFDDPGTYIEIGYAVARGIPTFVYDPLSMARNCMVTELPNVVSNDLDEILTEVFSEASKQHANER